LRIWYNAHLLWVYGFESFIHPQNSGIEGFSLVHEGKSKKAGGRLLTQWVLEVINSWKICGAKENIG
jgi:hypothetical protein